MGYIDSVSDLGPAPRAKALRGVVRILEKGGACIDERGREAPNF